jgi:AraC-like DNA-binding protein
LNGYRQSNIVAATMKGSLLREITPLTQNDCFAILSRTKSSLDSPLHYHEEFELNFIQNAKGAKRMIGDHMGQIDDWELVLIGPNLRHGWFTDKCKSKEIKEVTIQFHRDLFDDKFLQRNQMSYIRNMLEQSLRGILFSKECIRSIAPRLEQLPQKHGFESVLELLSILHTLSMSLDVRTLSGIAFRSNEKLSYNSRRISQVMAYLNNNFEKEISLAEVAKLATMSEVAFSRFFKARTGKTFVDTLNEIRLGNATRMLIDTTQSVGEVAYRCGFNNLSNFNRIFKKKKDCTPKEFRSAYNASGTRMFV